MNEYDDILSLPHPVSRRHRRMSPSERAAQFMPFAALTGFGALVEDTVREKAPRPELSEGEVEQLNLKLNRLARAGQNTRVNVSFVREDFDSGSFRTVHRQGILSRVDADRGQIVLDGDTAICFSDILTIEEA